MITCVLTMSKVHKFRIDCVGLYFFELIGWNETIYL